MKLTGYPYVKIPKITPDPLLVMVVHDYLIGAPGVFFFSVIKQ